MKKLLFVLAIIIFSCEKPEEASPDCWSCKFAFCYPVPAYILYFCDKAEIGLCGQSGVITEEEIRWFEKQYLIEEGIKVNCWKAKYQWTKENQ